MGQGQGVVYMHFGADPLAADTGNAVVRDHITLNDNNAHSDTMSAAFSCNSQLLAVLVTVKQFWQT